MIMRVESGEHIHLGGYNEMYNVLLKRIYRYALCKLTVHVPGNIPGVTLLKHTLQTNPVKLYIFCIFPRNKSIKNITITHISQCLCFCINIPFTAGNKIHIPTLQLQPLSLTESANILVVCPHNSFTVCLPGKQPRVK